MTDAAVVVYLVVRLAAYPHLPSVIVSVHDSERACVLEAGRRGLMPGGPTLVYRPGVIRHKGQKWSCEVRT